MSNNNWKKTRLIGQFETIKHRYYIFCEGIVTEPNYFRSIERLIKQNPIYKNVVLIEIQGLGRDTRRIIEYAERYVQENKIKNGQIWCVYDKDSFTADSFNYVSERARTLNKQSDSLSYNVAWSNECFEYWYILHFSNYTANNNRKFYIEYLTNEFKRIGLEKYKKNNGDMFDILLMHGNMKNAISFAQKQLRFFDGQTDSDSAPATKVHILLQELAQYLPQEIKNKII